ncbi:MAG: DegT/DnrJ/EryC1/StrS family aminotransferase [Magnetococcales bacterium]|nr:DegT/DnrJ/EryC1/StrS family aminotransferase [Magnetococcales bacterium]
MKSLIPWADRVITPREKTLVSEALDSTWISDGPFVTRFEEKFLQLNEATWGVTASNGTTALHLALLTLGIGSGDEVIVPGYTFAAPANMTLAVGARPVYADVRDDDWLLDPVDVEAHITRKTRAIIAVHLYGAACDMTALKIIAERYGLLLIEDAAEACLTRFDGKPVGSLGDAGCFSFQATKTISMGEGGFVTVREKILYDRMVLIRNHGMTPAKRYWHHVIGHNFRLPNLQAALGCGQLEQVETIIDRRRLLYQRYKTRLEGERGIRLQAIHHLVEPVIWTLALELDPAVFPERSQVIQRMRNANIETRPGFYPMSQMPIYDAPDLPVSSRVGKQILCLPFYPMLDEELVDYICGILLGLRY